MYSSGRIECEHRVPSRRLKSDPQRSQGFPLAMGVDTPVQPSSLVLSNSDYNFPFGGSSCHLVEHRLSSMARIQALSNPPVSFATLVAWNYTYDTAMAHDMIRSGASSIRKPARSKDCRPLTSILDRIIAAPYDPLIGMQLLPSPSRPSVLTHLLQRCESAAGSC